MPITRWDGTAWQPFGTPLNGEVYALTLLPTGDVVAAGQFLDAGGNPNCDRIARWDGTAWQPLGTGLNRLEGWGYAGYNPGAVLTSTAGGEVAVGGSFMAVGDGSKPMIHFGIYHAAPLSPTVSSFTPPSGGIGASVVITGSNLTGATAVWFGALPAASFSVNGAGTQLTAVVPAGAGYDQLRVIVGPDTLLTTAFFCTEYVATATGASRCGDGSVTLTASGAPTTGAAADRYAWYTTATGGTPISGATGSSYATPSLSATTTYYVAVSPAVGCEGARVAVVATINAVLTPAIAAAGPTTFCQGDSVVLTASGGGTYLWSTGDTTTRLVVQASGSYGLTVTGAGGCQASAAPVVVQVEPLPATPGISQSPGPGGGLLLTSSAPAGNQWYLNGAPIAGATGPTYSIISSAQSGTYTVVTSSATGCVSAPSAGQLIVITDLWADTSAAAWQLSPNPVRGAVQCVGAPAQAVITVSNGLGRQVRVQTTDARGAATLDLTGLPPGLYLVRAGGQTRRLVVE